VRLVDGTMVRRRAIETLYLAVVLLCICCFHTAAARSRKPTEEEENIELVKNVEVHFLVQVIGKQIYDYVDRPKYKFYIYMTVGKLPNEKSTIALLSTLCNVLYGCCVWAGFLILPRDYMLLGTLLTLYVGPAMILVLIGAFGMTLAAFAIYPVTSVLVIWLFHFLTSQLAQSLGKGLGLDSDKDGDVDLLDFLHWMASTRVGRFVGLPGLYKILSKMNKDPFQEIHKRLDLIMEHITTKNQPVSHPS
jgi:hypothetical protein